MIVTVARKEFRGVLRDGRVLVSAGVLLLLGLVALASAGARYASLNSERAIAQALIQAQWIEQGDKNPHSAAHYGIHAFRPALPLSFFDPGVLAYEGVSIWLEAHKRNFPAGRPADDLTALARFGELSLGFVFQALVPLGLLLMTYAAFSSERESGTLRQLLASGVTPAQLFAGKFLGLGGAALLLLAPLLLLCFGVLVFASGTTWLPAAMVLLAACIVYAALLLLLALTVSARASSSQSALLVLLAFWAVITFVVPRIAADLGRILQPTPTLSEFQRGVDEMVREAELSDVRKQVEQAASGVVEDVNKMAESAVDDVKKTVDPTGELERSIQSPATFDAPASLEPQGPPSPVEPVETAALEAPQQLSGDPEPTPPPVQISPPEPVKPSSPAAA